MSTAERTIEELATQDYKYGFVTDVEADTLPRGLNEEVIREISGGRASRSGCSSGASRRTARGRRWKSRSGGTSSTTPSTSRTSSTTPRRRRRRRSPASTRSIRRSGGPSRSSASRSTSRRRWRAWPSTRSSTASRWRRPSGASWPSWGSSSARSPRRCGTTPTWCAKYLGTRRAAHRQLLRRAQLGGLQRRLVRLHPEGRALPDGAVDLLPHQRAEHGAVRADADHRGRGGVRELPRRVHGADARREPAARGGRRAGRARPARRSSTRPCRTGIRATRKARAASTTS